jgi:hypothetical protein
MTAGVFVHPNLEKNRGVIVEVLRQIRRNPSDRHRSRANFKLR